MLFKDVIWMLQCLHVKFIGFEVDVLQQPFMLKHKDTLFSSFLSKMNVYTNFVFTTQTIP